MVAYNDYTFADTLTEKPYWAAESRYLVMGGETCGDNPTYTNCGNTLHEMNRFHWTYCNDYYYPDVLTRWQTEGCLETIKRRLGYRLQLTQATLPVTTVQGQNMALSFTLQNTGFAAPVNARNVQILLRNTVSGAVFTFPIATADPRYWFAGASHTVFTNIALPLTIPCGNYELLLHLPDPQPTLATNPHYAIRLANNGTWENTTGYNKLLHTVQVQFPLAITGLSDACGGSLQTYSVPAQTGATYVWTVSGGSIVSGQGTAQITVWWNSGMAGTVAVSQTVP